MNTIEGTFDSLVTLLQKLYGLPAIALVMLGCIILGYALRYVKAFPNEGIPVAVILFGGVVFPLIADANNDLTLRVWLIRNVLIGLTVGFVSWLAHNKLLKPIEDKLTGEPAKPISPSQP